MKPIYLMCVLLWLAGLAEAKGKGFSAAATRCGTDPAFRLLCGNVGTQAAPSSPTSISACDTTPGTPQRITANGNYQLTGNLTAAVGDYCLAWSAEQVTLDLNGFTVTGRLYGSNVNGVKIQNGTVNCTHADSGANAGCIRAQNKTAGTAQNELVNVTVRNASGGANNARNVMIEAQAGATYSGSQPQWRIHKVDTLSASATTTTRWTNVYVGGVVGETWFHDSKGVCAADTNACQNFICFSPLNCKAHNNYLPMENNTTAATGRALTADAQLASCSLRSADRFEAYNNDLPVADNRAMRARCVRGVRFYDNTVGAGAPVITHASATIAALHVGDADGGEDVSDIDFQAYNNLYYVTDGVVLMERNSTGTILRNEKVIGVGTTTNGKFADVRAPLAPGTASTVTIMNNPTAGTAGFTSPNTVAAGATINHCNSGAVSGAGTNNGVSC